MPRRARRQSATGVYHVIMRGNNKAWIYKKVQYKRLLKKLMFEQEKGGLIEIIAWCIMSNHVHMVLYADLSDLTKAMTNINQNFAQRFNHFEERIGHVYDGRYKSECVEDENYLLCLIRYVHNNPVHAGIVSDPRDYIWSSFQSYLNNEMKHLSIDIIKLFFGDCVQRFIDYHGENDEKVYFDIRDDMDKRRKVNAEKIIARFLEENCVDSVVVLKLNKKVYAKMIAELVEQTELSRVQIAEILGISKSNVTYIYNNHK